MSKNKKNTGVILGLSAGHLCHDIYSSFLAPVLPLLIEKFSLTYAAAGFISVLLRIPSIFSPLIGSLAGRVNLKYMIIISPSVTAVAICLIGNAPNFWTIAVLALVAGLSSACFHVPPPVILRNLAGSRVGAAMSFFQTGGELSRTIGPLVVLGAVSMWTLSGLYRLIPIGVLVSLFLLWVLKDVPSSRREKDAGLGKNSIIRTFTGQKLLFISIAGILLSKCFTASVLGAYLPTYLTVKGSGLWFAGGSLSLLQAFAIIGVCITGPLSDRIACEKMLLLLAVAAPVSMFFCVYSEGWLFILSLCFAGLTAFSSTPVMLSLIQKRNFDFPAIANGMYMTLNFILSSVIVLAAGRLSDMAGIIFTFKCCAVLSCAGIPFAVVLNRNQKTPAGY